MPELPEVETTINGLVHFLQGRRLTRVETRRDNLRWPFPPDLRQRMEGAFVTKLSRRAKYGLIFTDRDDVMIFHLGMSGKWRVDVDEIEKHDHLLLGTDDGRLLALNDPRRFGSVDILPASEINEYPPFVKMGPEPLGGEFNAAMLHASLKDKKCTIKAALLNQNIVAGLGNIYVCEALYAVGLHPQKLAYVIKINKIKALVEAIKEILERAIAAGGSSLRDFAAPDGELGYFSHQWSVYGREGQQCKCGDIIIRITQQGRSSFLCPKCQK
ncbi:DNA-formamidopyrimidine glycosylase [Sphingorhabdus lutea]|uniref:Formamidopyrimidine-DNA glycosylase n=1 Tax=Sphingorhabdus lutea TaxID=1913578 RepID=A0A1L3JES7_9SPHN|nr:bifunctional DNA-formamidopyrimidine glycosylase/DNA-(apurinic or apyrimidinic site) lyase [Sphingorhabdus lutea]APG63630.1 DNA-formamidopyrimidine glycosylase [Sphingorhabdus lutea]